MIIFGGDSERFANFSASNLIVIDLMGEKSNKKMKLAKDFNFSLKIRNFSSVLTERDIFSHEILSQNYPCLYLNALRL